MTASSLSALRTDHELLASSMLAAKRPMRGTYCGRERDAWHIVAMATNGSETSDDRYTHGHHESVLRSHSWRTAENSVAYVLPHLSSGLDLLDIGCGPGTITGGLAVRVAPGRVVGVDRAEEIVEQAAASAATGGTSGSEIEFRVGDVYALDFDDESFDVVHAHQVLQHLVDPIAAMVEMRRVLRPGGLLAVRESDFGAFVWAPAEPALDRWLELYFEVTAANGADAAAGRHLLGWAQQVGFADDAIEVSSSNWTFATPDRREWLGTQWADRTRYSALAEQALYYGLADADELEDLAQGWLRWMAAPDGFYMQPSMEILARK